MIFSPNRPCGLNTKNNNAKTYANQFSVAPPIIGAIKNSNNFSPAPIIKPPTIAPGIEVKPPNIKTGKAFKAIKDSENWTPDLAPHIIPATKATNPEIDHTSTQITLKLIPTESAA